MDKKLDLPRIAKVINDQKPDLVGLQEVDRGVERTQHIDEIAELAKLTKMDYAFAFNLPYQGGQYGVAILSRFRILATDGSGDVASERDLPSGGQLSLFAEEQFRATNWLLFIFQQSAQPSGRLGILNLERADEDPAAR